MYVASHYNNCSNSHWTEGLDVVIKGTTICGYENRMVAADSAPFWQYDDGDQ